jgi:hypothetical protein
MFGNAFYQDGEFICDDNIYTLFEIKNKYIGLFLSCLIRNYLQNDFGRQFREYILLKIKIDLPIDENGKPN